MKNCPNCGMELPDEEVLCPGCGCALPARRVEEPVQNNVIACVALVVSFFVAIAGLILGIIGLNSAKKMNGDGKGLAIAAIVISSISIVSGLILTAVIVATILTGGTFFGIPVSEWHFVLS